MLDKKIEKIEIWSRGKNKDVYGNPYVAYRAEVECSYVSFFRKITITKGMFWGSNSDRYCLIDAIQGVNEALETNISVSDKRIVHHHKTVYKDSELENPEGWKV